MPHDTTLASLAAGPTGVAGTATGVDPETARRLVAGEVAAILAGTPEPDVGGATLTLPLALSVAMRRHGVDADRLVTAMRLLRGALLTAGRLDTATEPVPLGSREPAVAALHLARYLHALLHRAARATGRTPTEVARTAAAALRAT